jgi:hypothetical protein
MAKTNKKKVSEMRPLEDNIKAIIEQVIEERELNLAAEDVKAIVKEIMPDLDNLISKKVKKHFHAIGLMLMENFKVEE